jgi:acetyl esterase/lipase
MADLSAIDSEVRNYVQAMRAGYPWEVLVSDGAPAFRARLADITGGRPAPAPNPAVHSEDRMIRGPGGPSSLRVRIHRPADQRADLPCYMHIHGGGYVMGGVEGQDPFIAPHVEALDCVVVSVDYRLAPEHPYPAAVEDCYAALQWIVGHAEELRIDPSRVAVGGASAGGGLAAAVALLSRDREGPTIIFQYLVYPMLDDRHSTPSSREFAGDWPGLPLEASISCWDAYLDGRAGGVDVPPYAAPARATDLVALPSAYIDCGGLEVFRDEAIEYAQRLMQAGVTVELHVHPAVFHGWDLVAPNAAISVRARTLQFRALRAALHLGA